MVTFYGTLFFQLDSMRCFHVYGEIFDFKLPFDILKNRLTKKYNLIALQGLRVPKSVPLEQSNQI